MARVARSVRRRWWLWLLAVAVVWVLAASLSAAGAVRQLERGRAAAASGRELVLDRDMSRARFELDRAKDHFGAAHGVLAGPLLAPVRILPIAGPNLVAVTDLAEAAQAAAAAGEEIAEAVGGLDGGAEALAPRGGALPVAAFTELAGPVRRADALLRRSMRVLKGTYDQPVIGQVADARAELADAVIPAATATDRASELLAVLPEVLGADGPRRYLVVPQNPAESRGTGGFIGAYAIATLDQGRFRFSRVGPIDDLPSYPADEVVAPNPDYARRYNRYGGAGFWKNINLTPDFPSAARAMETLFAKGAGETIDGVIAADPFALQAMLEVAGPVEIAGFGKVDADEIVDVVTNSAYVEITDPDRRKQLLGELFVGAFLGFLERGGEGDPLRTAQVLGTAVGEGHLVVHSTDPDAQAAFLRAGIAGELRRADRDFLAVVANAGSATKLDYYLERTVSYAVELSGDGRATTRADLAFRNEAPRSGTVAYVIGPNVDGLEAGENRILLSVYGPPNARLEDFGRSLGDEAVRTETELGHTVHTTLVHLPSKAEERIVLTREQSQTWAKVGRGGVYRLTVQGQTTLRPVPLHVVITLPEGMVATGLSPGLGLAADGQIVFVGEMSALKTFEVQFAPEGTSRALTPAPSATP